MRSTPIVLTGLSTVAAFVAILAGSLTTGHAGPAPTQVVTRFDDPPPGLCQPGDCSLREAVLAANTQAGPQLIVLDAGTYSLQINGRLEDGGLTGDIDITGNLTITGAGMNKTTIDANGASTHDRAFDIHEGAQVVITDLRITGGLLEGDDEMFDGGAALRNDGLTVLERLLLDDNHITGINSGLHGGAIENRYLAPLLQLNDSIVRNNSIEGGNGGGIGNAGTMTIRRTTIDDNHVENAGGGVSTRGQSLTIIQSTVSNNTSSYTGGGVLADFGNTYIINSTISGNSAADTGGGIYESGDDMHIRSSTITNNTAGYSGFSAHAGGGVYTRYGGVFFANTIIAGNEDDMGSPSDCAGNDDFPSPLTSQGYNLVQDLDGCLIDGNTTGNIAGQDPDLGPLGNNGGPTLTQALDPTSPARDAGNPGNCRDHTGLILQQDQRGGARHVGSGCDIGAYEFGATPPATPSPMPTASPTPAPETATPTAPPETPTPAPPTPSPAPSATPAPTRDGIQGDTDCDKDVDTVDGLFVLRDVAGFPPSECIEQGDVDCDGDRDSVDALGILRHVAALPPLNQQEPCPDIGTPL